VIPTVLRVEDPSSVGDLRRQATALADGLGLDETTRGKLAIVATEIATNVCRHGGGGTVLLRGVEDATGTYVEILAWDRGRGIPDVGRALQDGFSTAGSAGTGLGAISRISAVFDLWSAVGAGTVLLSRVGNVAPLPFEIAGHGLAAPNEEVSGDGFAIQARGARLRILVVDGLGHGMPASLATKAALETFAREAARSPTYVVEEAHANLRATRGAAVGLAEIDAIDRTIHWVGVGNVSGTIFGGGRRLHSALSAQGIVGHNMRRAPDQRYDWPPDGLLILHSDGITTSWDLAKYPGLARRHPGLIAGILLRDHVRGRDDATVVVARDRRRTSEEPS
jgi:anti-sigma regulatory factor (Ser/Thr protein kinase)